MSEAINYQSRKLSFIEMTIAVLGAIVTAALFAVSYLAQTKTGFVLCLATATIHGAIIAGMAWHFQKR